MKSSVAQSIAPEVDARYLLAIAPVSRPHGVLTSVGEQSNIINSFWSCSGNSIHHWSLMSVRKPVTNTLFAMLKKAAKQLVSDERSNIDRLNQQATLASN